MATKIREGRRRKKGDGWFFFWVVGKKKKIVQGGALVLFLAQREAEKDARSEDAVVEVVVGVL